MTIPNHSIAPISSSGWFTDLRSSLRARRQEKAARRRLRDELASYRTPAELDDLYAAMRRSDDTVSDDVRHLIDAHAGAQHRPFA
jgi:hypothetical protein